MLICTVLLVYTFCNTVTSKDLTPAHQIKIRISQPTIPTYTYPYQEDLISTVQFLKEESSTKKAQVGTLIKLLKKVLTKYIDVLKHNDEKTEYNTNVTKVENVHELIRENNTRLEEKEQIVLNEIDNENSIVKEVETENISEEVYEIDSNTFDPQNPLEIKVNSSPEIKEKIDTSVISVCSEFIEDDPTEYMRNFRPKPIYYPNQQDSYVLERPEPKIVEAVDSQLKKVVKSNPDRNCNKVMKNNKKTHLKKEPFSIPCVKASDILDETLGYVPKEAYCKNNPQPKLNSNVQESTIESPVSNYITICSESDDTVAMLFKPKTISLMQTYGNLLKKITVTVLVPFHVTKLVL